MSELQKTVSLHAMALFERKGYSETSVTEIIETIPIARRTFFRHFDGKDDTVLKPHRVRFATFSNALGRPFSGHPLDHLLAAIDEALAEMWLDEDTHRRRYRLIFGTPELSAQMIVSDSRYIQASATHLRPAFKDGSLLPDMLANAGMGAVNRMLSHFSTGATIPSCKTILSLMKDHLRRFSQADGALPASSVVVASSTASPDELIRALALAGLIRSGA